MSDAAALARELIAARSTRQTIPIPPSARDRTFDLTAAYAVEAQILQSRQHSGHRPVGYKVGFANKAVWRALGLETLVWAHMYDDTVQCADSNTASLALDHAHSPKIEPEIVFKMKHAPGGDSLEAAAVLNAVEWIALGFEIIDCPFPDWKFQPADFVAAFGFHVALIVGEPRSIDSATIPTLVDQLPRFTVDLMKDGDLVATGGGRSVLRSPALCVAELTSAMSRRGAQPLAAGDLVSSGTLTESQPIAAGQTWTASVEGIELPPLTLRVQM